MQKVLSQGKYESVHDAKGDSDASSGLWSDHLFNPETRGHAGVPLDIHALGREIGGAARA